MVKNKIKIIHLLAITIITFVCNCVASCGSDDDDGLTSLQLMQNKWMSHDAEFHDNGDWAELTQNIWTFFFTSENEGILQATNKWIDSSGFGDEGRDTAYIFFTYTISGNMVICQMEDGNTYRLAYRDGKLWRDDFAYEPSFVSSSDRSMIAQQQEAHRYRGDYNLDFTVGFDTNSFYPTTYSKSQYSHTIPMAFGVPENMLMRGITEFGIAVRVVNGTVDNTTRKTYGDALVSVQSIGGVSTKCFSHSISDNSAHTWQTTLELTSSTKTVTFEYTYFLYAQGKGYVFGDSFLRQTYTPNKIVNL